MSQLITEEDITSFEKLEKEWLTDQGSYDAYWERKLEDEEELFDWMRERFERTVLHFSKVSGLKSVFFSKMVDILQEAMMTGFFFGELRWNKDIDTMFSGMNLSEPEEKNEG